MNRSEFPNTRKKDKVWKQNPRRYVCYWS